LIGEASLFAKFRVPGLIASTIFNALPISMIVIGVQKLDECPAQPYIPIWMIITGAIFILDEYHGNVYLNPVDWLFAGIFAITLCVGEFTPKSTRVNEVLLEYSDYCDRFLYGMAFVIVCIFCSIIALFSLCCCGCCVYVLYK
uniref:EamA domain-containing protein n=1 Tax=Toxocara canis TaxID=6265 RepID=A0A183U1L4_TOXCA